MKLEDIFEQDIKQAVKSLRSNRKGKKSRDLKMNLNFARRGNNPKQDGSPNSYYDGYGDDAEQALTNFQAGGK